MLKTKLINEEKEVCTFSPCAKCWGHWGTGSIPVLTGRACIEQEMCADIKQIITHLFTSGQSWDSGRVDLLSLNGGRQGHLLRNGMELSRGLKGMKVRTRVVGKKETDQADVNMNRARQNLLLVSL